MAPKSPPALRILQFVDTALGGSGSLQGINTTLVMDRGIIAAKDQNSLYMLRREATDAPSGTDIIAPADGSPGRWFKYPTASASTGLLSILAYLKSAPLAGQLPTFNFPDSTSFVVGDAGTESLIGQTQIGDVFDVTDTSIFRVIYTGPTAVYQAWAQLAVDPADVEEAQLDFAVGISINGDITGLDLNDQLVQNNGVVSEHIVTDDETKLLVNQRMGVVESGDTIDIVLFTGNAAARTATGIMLKLIATPVA